MITYKIHIKEVQTTEKVNVPVCISPEKYCQVTLQRAKKKIGKRSLCRINGQATWPHCIVFFTMFILLKDR